MTSLDKAKLSAQAIAILQENDRGTYTIPTKGLYPFQWNWDSCLTALGQAHIEEARAWREIQTLFEHQWDDGMVPHIVFHQLDDGYFPGPDVWGTQRDTPTSGITQPAVAGFALKRLFDRAKDKSLARQQVSALLPKVAKWHEWFYQYRDPKGTGLVAIIHPWESGRDNSMDWDDAFKRVPTEGVKPYTRRDTSHANPNHRPTQAEYDRYIWLVQHFRALHWDNSQLHDASPFQLVDPGFNAILIRSCADLACLAEQLGMQEIATQQRAFSTKGIQALGTLWNESYGQYTCFDRVADSLVDSPSVAGLLPVFAAIEPYHVAGIVKRIEALATRSQYLVPSHDPNSDSFDAKRYWRGPVWLIVNYLIADGLQHAGENATVDRITNSSLALIEKGGFAEYYDPHTGEGCGGGRFTWTAAMVLEFLQLVK